jgi:hypothetical protein
MQDETEVKKRLARMHEQAELPDDVPRHLVRRPSRGPEVSPFLERLCAEATRWLCRWSVRRCGPKPSVPWQPADPSWPRTRLRI